MPIKTRHRESLLTRAPELLKKLDEEQKLIEVKRQLVLLGRHKSTLRALDLLEDDPQALETAMKNPRKFLREQGVDIPRGWQVAIAKGSWNLHVGGSVGSHSFEAGYDSGRGFYATVDGESIC
jgi:hypothetical protein